MINCRWKIVTHGGVDGFSCLVVFMRASTNNKAQTVFDSFKEAVDSFGLPKRVRSDKGEKHIH